MTGFDDELEHVCAWGRWSSGAARNDATMVADGPGERSLPRVRSTTADPSPRRVHGCRRLRLVADSGAGPRILRPVT